MCDNRIKAHFLKQLAAEIRAAFAEWRARRRVRAPAADVEPAG